MQNIWIKGLTHHVFQFMLRQLHLTTRMGIGLQFCSLKKKNPVPFPLLAHSCCKQQFSQYFALKSASGWAFLIPKSSVGRWLARNGVPINTGVGFCHGGWREKSVVTYGCNGPPAGYSSGTDAQHPCRHPCRTGLDNSQSSNWNETKTHAIEYICWK